MTAKALLYSLSRVKYSFCTMWVRNSSENNAYQVLLNHYDKWVRDDCSKLVLKPFFACLWLKIKLWMDAALLQSANITGQLNIKDTRSCSKMVTAM